MTRSRRSAPRSTVHREDGSLRRREPEAASTHGLNEPGLPPAVDLLPQAAHVNVDEVREVVVLLLPHVLAELGAGDQTADVAHQVFEDRVLLRGQLDRLLTAAHPMPDRVELKVGHLEDLWARALRAAQERAPAREELGEGERLRQVVVRAGVETGHAIDNRVAGREHGRLDAGMPESPAELDPWHAGQEPVKDDQVVVADPGELLAFLTVASDVDDKPLLSQPLRKEPRRLSVILDEQDSHRWRAAGARPLSSWAVCQYPAHRPFPGVEISSVPLREWKLSFSG